MDGKKFQKKLREMGITQFQVAEILGITQQSVSAMVKTNSIKTTTLEKIAQAIGKDISVFFSESELQRSQEIENLKKLLEEKDQQIRRLQSQTDRLLAIIEKMQ